MPWAGLSSALSTVPWAVMNVARNTVQWAVLSVFLSVRSGVQGLVIISG